MGYYLTFTLSEPLSVGSGPEQRKLALEAALADVSTLAVNP
jgi:hypothetical protein